MLFYRPLANLHYNSNTVTLDMAYDTFLIFFLLCQLEVTASLIAQSGVPEPLEPSPDYGTVDGRGFEYDDVIHHLSMLSKRCYHIVHLRVDA